MDLQKDGLRFGPIGDKSAHLGVDMQRLFGDETPWTTPWMERILPNVVQLAERHPEQTIFTRFIPAASADEATGTWRRYWRRWEGLTLDNIAAEFIELAPEVKRFAPPAKVIDKSTYSPWIRPELSLALKERDVDTLLISGGETDICVLATVLGAIDAGYRVVLVADALCSSSDQTHDALLKLYRNRFGQQVETARLAEILDAWG